MNIFIAFHSIYGHTYTLAKYIAKGASVSNANIKLARIKETLPNEIIKAMGGLDTVKQFEHLPIAAIEDLEWADCIVLGAPTYYGKISSQLSAFLDSTGVLYAEGKLKNKIGGAFTSSGCQNGGAEESLHNIINFFMHQSMIPVGIDTTNSVLERNDTVFGSCPYGIYCVAGEKNTPKDVNDIEKQLAFDYGLRLANITKILKNEQIN